MELVIDLKEKSYPIIIEKGIINRVGEEVSKVYKGKRIFIITDHNVSKYYGDKVLFSLKNKNFEVKLLSLEPGEKTKGFNILPDIYNEFLNFNLRNSIFIFIIASTLLLLNFFNLLTSSLDGFTSSTTSFFISSASLTFIENPIPIPLITYISALNKLPNLYITSSESALILVASLILEIFSNASIFALYPIV